MTDKTKLVSKKHKLNKKNKKYYTNLNNLPKN